MDPEDRTQLTQQCPSWKEFKQENTAPGVDSEDGVLARNEPERASAFVGTDKLGS